jgi:hypothetical protein
MLNIEYQAETEDDMADLASSLLMARSTAFMAKKFIATRIELSEGYYELQGAFDTIQTLIKPALDYFSNEMMSKPKQRRKHRTHGA